jgi:hypothetical protein
MDYDGKDVSVRRQDGWAEGEFRPRYLALEGDLHWGSGATWIVTGGMSGFDSLRSAIRPMIVKPWPAPSEGNRAQYLLNKPESSCNSIGR